MCVCAFVWTTPWTRADLEARERTAQAWIEAVSGRACVAYQTKQFARNIMRWVCSLWEGRYRDGRTTALCVQLEDETHPGQGVCDRESESLALTALTVR